MSFGRLCQKQYDAVKRAIYLRTVHDLGAGDLELSYKLIQAGAFWKDRKSKVAVFAVDKEPMSEPSCIEGPYGIVNIKTVQTTFEQYSVKIGKRGSHNDWRPLLDTVFISWPVNYFVPGLCELVREARQVIYLGSNTGGNACGFPELFREFLKRRIVSYVPEETNTLIVYGSFYNREWTPKDWKMASTDVGYGTRKKIKGEEFAALLQEPGADLSGLNGNSLLPFVVAEALSSKYEINCNGKLNVKS